MKRLFFLSVVLFVPVAQGMQKVTLKERFEQEKRRRQEIQDRLINEATAMLGGKYEVDLLFPKKNEKMKRGEKRKIRMQIKNLEKDKHKIKEIELTINEKTGRPIEVRISGDFEMTRRHEHEINYCQIDVLGYGFSKKKETFAENVRKLMEKLWEIWDKKHVEYLKKRPKVQYMQF